MEELTKEFRWDMLKSQRLKKTRGVSFDEIIINSRIIDIIKHPQRANQRVPVCWYKKYIWLVPFVVEKEYYFLKTLYPSRKLTKTYKNEGAL